MWRSAPRASRPEQRGFRGGLAVEVKAMIHGVQIATGASALWLWME